MRTMMFLIAVVTCAGCEMAGGDGVAVQAVAGPGGVAVTAPAAGELTVSWSADAAAWKYYVFQSTGGPSGVFAFTASVLDPSEMPPAPTTYTATGLTGGTRYCYAIESAYPDGTMSELGAAGCGTASGGGTPQAHTRAISGLTVVPEWPTQAGGPGATRIADTWTFQSQNYMYFPVPTNIGETIAGYQVYVFKGSSSAFTVTSDLIEVDSASGSQAVLGSASNTTNAPGRLLLGEQNPPRVVTPGTTYLIRIADGSGSGASNADSFTDATLFLN